MRHGAGAGTGVWNRFGGAGSWGRQAVATALLVLAASGCCGFFAVNSLIRVRAFTADSMNYVDVARRVAGGDGLVQSTGGFNQPFYLSGDLDLPSAFTAQAPGYPLAIAGLSSLGMDAADAALVAAAFSYGAVLFLVFLLGRRMGGPRAGLVALGGALVFVPLAHWSRAALSDSPAVAVVLLFFLLLDRSFVRPPRHALLTALGLGLLAGAAFSLRYALWPLPLVGVAALWLNRAAGLRAPRFSSDDSRKRGAGAVPAPGAPGASRSGAGALHSTHTAHAGPGHGSPAASQLYRSFAFAAGALAPFAAILARNLVAEGRLMPAAMPAVRSLGENLSLAVTALVGGWRSTALGNWPDAAIGIASLLILLVLAARQPPQAGEAGQNESQAASRAWGLLSVLVGLWVVVYLAAVVWRGSQANFDPIGARLALPATVPLIPVFGALLAGALPRGRRFAWLPAALLVLCLGAAFAREAAVWSSGRDARAVELRSERQQWLRDHAVPGDLVIGGGTMDVPFLVPGSHAISYAGLPYTEVLTYPDLERIANRHCPDFDRLLLVVRPTVQLGGGRSDEDPGDWLGPFVAAARAGRHEAYPLLEPLATLNEARIYRIVCR